VKPGPRTYSAMHEQEGMIQLFAVATCPFLDILMQQVAESYLAHASVNATRAPKLGRLYSPSATASEAVGVLQCV